MLFLGTAGAIGPGKERSPVPVRPSVPPLRLPACSYNHDQDHDYHGQEYHCGHGSGYNRGYNYGYHHSYNDLYDRNYNYDYQWD